MKQSIWIVLARLLNRGARAIRRQPSPREPEEWRSVRFSFSHYAEDLLVLHLLRDKISRGESGIYVDVGAFDPVRFSNTLLLHQHGWIGINVDPNAAQIEKFRRCRPADANLCAIVSDSERPVDYLEYPTGGTNRLVDPSEARRENVNGEPPSSTVRMTTTTLADLLAEHLPPGAKIDFLNVDCEGEDLAALRGLDWSRWSPEVIAIEAYDDDARAAVTDFVVARGYTPAAQCLLTLIFVRSAGRVSDLRAYA
ncbi:FkbM family methyltransferase (plasmid) [Tundrisphaera sp. TA3]|uniref:FkbM family methyltransferase n=1 Tax=Tundrisphaera sp. TA3 TaxID=3435775 RepID=UPI003EBD148A